MSSDDARLVLRPLAAVAVADVDHHLRPQAGAGDRGADARDAGRIVVRRLAAAQNDVAVVVAGRRRDRAAALLGHGQEVMRMRRRLHRVDRDLHVAVGAVLEADRARQTRSELAMHLALGRARADRAPGHQVGDVLRRDHVEELAARPAGRAG